VLFNRLSVGVTLTGALLSLAPLQANAQWISGKSIRNIRTVGENGAVAFATVEPHVNPGNCRPRVTRVMLGNL
jgi:hypothetical protein